MKQTTVQVSKETRNRINNKKQKGVTISQVLYRLLDQYEGLF